MKMKISIIGLGKLGSPMAAFFASKGHEVIGVDVNRKFVSKVKECKAPVDEPGLHELMVSLLGGPKVLDATTNFEAAILETEMTFIVVPTPSLSSGAFDLSHVQQAAMQIGIALAKKNTYHLVVITSTVMPGHSQKITDTIEYHSGKVCGVDFGLCYNPEFIALGSVLHDLEHPDFVLIGRSDARAGNELYRFYGNTIYRSPSADAAPAARPDLWEKDDRPPMYQTTFVNAEIAKLALNCYVTMKISFANLLGRVCETIPGADVDSVTKALGYDTRIGDKYLKSGTPFGGPCFPRDNFAFQTLLPSQDYSLPPATTAENIKTIIRIAARVQDNIRAGDSVGIVGMSYKPGTYLREESPGVWLEQLLQSGAYGHPSNIATWDKQDGGETLEEFVDDCDLVVFMLPYSIPTSLYHLFESKVIVDPWRIIKSDRLPKSTTYVPLGRG